MRPRLADLRAPRPPARREVDLIAVLNGFPQLSETFVLHELLDLERRGVRLHIIALRRPEAPVAHEALDRLRAPVEYLPEPTGSVLRRAARTAYAALFLRDPVRYLDALGEILLSPDYSSSKLARSALLAHRAIRLGSPPLYIHFAHKPATFGRFAALLGGLPYALSAHAKDIWLTPPDELAAKVRGAAAVLTCSEEARAYLTRLAGGSNTIHLAHHGVELPAAVARNGSGPTPVILSVGRLVEKKGYPTLLRAAAILRDRGVDFTIRVAGEGPEWPALQRLAHDLSVADRVAFLGPLSEAEVRCELASADIFALPCQKLANGDRDGIPNALLEAMAWGLPVVSSTLAGVSEAVVDGDCGLLVAPDDEVALAEAVNRLLSSDELRGRLGDRARRRVEERFERSANLPAVHAALAAAGLLP